MSATPGMAGLRWRPAALVIALLLSSSSAAAAEKVKPAQTSLLGVRVGMTLDEARSLLDAAGTSDMPATPEIGSRGIKIAWMMPEGTFSNVALKADRKGRVVWVTGFVRPGNEVRFTELGELSTAARATDVEMIWNFRTPEGSRRVVAKGQGGKASVITIMSTELPPME